MTDVGSLVGQEVGGFFIQRELGRGGMGVVYLARDIKLRRNVALKFLAPHLVHDKDAVSRFEREARAVARLNHPNVVTIFGLGEHSGENFISMEYVEGHPLSQILAEGRWLSVTQTLSIGSQAARALNAAHDVGVVHRDIKPHNLMLQTSGSVKVMDFGLAQVKDASAKLTATGIRMGTPRYMSPEQVRGERTDWATDVYSLGVVLFECLTGKPPFDAESTLALMRLIETSHPPAIIDFRPSVPKDLCRSIERMLSKDPQERPRLPELFASSVESAAPQTKPSESTTVLSPRLPSHHQVRLEDCNQRHRPTNKDERPRLSTLERIGIRRLHKVLFALAVLCALGIGLMVQLVGFSREAQPDIANLETQVILKEAITKAIAEVEAGHADKVIAGRVRGVEEGELKAEDDRVQVLEDGYFVACVNEKEGVVVLHFKGYEPLQLDLADSGEIVVNAGELKLVRIGSTPSTPSRNPSKTGDGRTPISDYEPVDVIERNVPGNAAQDTQSGSPEVDAAPAREREHVEAAGASPRLPSPVLLSDLHYQSLGVRLPDNDADNLRRDSIRHKELLQSIHDRAPKIQSYKASGCLGENNRGYLETRDCLEVAQPETKTEIEVLMAEENADRRAFYAELVRLNQGDDAVFTLSYFERMYAFKRLQRSGSGEAYQLPPTIPGAPEKYSFEALENEPICNELGDNCEPEAWIVVP